MARRSDIEIPIAVDTGGTEKAIQNGLIDPVEDAEDALKKLGEVDAGKDIDRDLKKAQDATEDLDTELDQTRKSLDKLGFAARDAGDDAKRGMDRAGDGVKDFKSEANQTAKETAASFDGSAESIAGAFQEVAANALGGFGPAGAVAGLAIAAGLGTGIEAITKATEALEEARDTAFSVASAADALTGAIDVASGIREWTSDMEKFSQASDIATVTGWAVEDVIKALAGGGKPLGELTDAFKENELYTSVALGRVTELGGVLKGTEEGMTRGAVAAKASAKALYDYATSVADATGETDDLGNAVLTLPDGKQIVVDAATQTAYEDIDALERMKVADKTVKLKVDDSEVRSYRPQPIRIPATFETRGRTWQ